MSNTIGPTNSMAQGQGALPSTGKPRILTRLREETRALHEKLEKKSPLQRLFQPGVSLDDYKGIIIKFYGLYKALEPKLVEAKDRLGLDFNLEPRLKMQLLERDLKALGMSADEISQLPICADLPTLNTAEDVLGCLYVIEGSTLGGQFISRQLNNTFSLDENNGAAFFNGYGSETGPMWKSFGEFLVANAKTPSSENKIVKSASSTFNKIGEWLSIDKSVV